MSSNARRRAARREHQRQQDAVVPEVPGQPDSLPDRKDVTVIPGTAAASGGTPAGSEG